MQAAIDVLHKKRRPDGRWNAQAKHSGETHFNMERAGQARAVEYVEGIAGLPTVRG